MEETRAQAKAQGYVETVFGRRLYLPDINARNKQFQQAAERAASNAPMQGTAADIIKRAMISVDRMCAAGSGARIIMQVHDELVLEVETAKIAGVTDAVRKHMMAAADLRVPLKVDVGTGSNWDEAH
jgi:DNA polymerase-1